MWNKVAEDLETVQAREIAVTEDKHFPKPMTKVSISHVKESIPAAAPSKPARNFVKALQLS